MPVTFDDIVGRSRVRHGMVSNALGAKRAPGKRRGLRDNAADTFEGAPRTGVSSRVRSDLHGSRRTWAIHPSLRDAFSDIDARIDDAELEADGSGDADVVDCEVIASGAELRRWRLSLTDFHALLAGGTEAIAAYRAEQRRKEAVHKAPAPGCALSLPQSLPQSQNPTQAPSGAPEIQPTWGTRLWRALTWPVRAATQSLSQLLAWLSRQFLGA